MSRQVNAWIGVVGILLTMGVPPAAGAMAVVDVRAIAQLRQQLSTMSQQLSTARNQLTQAQRAFEAMTGGRGMEHLLSGTVRNYLPPDWTQLDAAIRQGVSSYHALAADLQATMQGNAVLSAQQIALMSPVEREQVEAARRSAAMLQVTARQALSATSNRFSAIQQLIDAIPRAQDPKAIMDLQARIAAEQGMLANEQTKLQVLYQAAQAEEWARVQRAREQGIAHIGSLRGLPAMGL
ncbi:MAG: type IV secretion system family protein [Chloroflexota bacterium]|nr:type IV secretion system family protein [Chloroflexota bacterium]